MGKKKFVDSSESAGSFYTIDGDDNVNSSFIISNNNNVNSTRRSIRPSRTSTTSRKMANNFYISDEETSCWSDEGLGKAFLSSKNNIQDFNFRRNSVQSESTAMDSGQIITTDSAETCMSLGDFVDYSGIPNVNRKTLEVTRSSRLDGIKNENLQNSCLLKSSESVSRLPVQRLTITELRERCLALATENPSRPNVVLCLDINTKFSPDDYLNSIGIKSKPTKRNTEEPRRPLNRLTSENILTMKKISKNEKHNIGITSSKPNAIIENSRKISNDTNINEKCSWRRHASVPTICVADMIRKNKFNDELTPVQHRQETQHRAVNNNISENTNITDITSWGSIIFCGQCDADRWTEETINITPDEIQQKIDQISPKITWKWLRSIFCCWNPWP